MLAVLLSFYRKVYAGISMGGFKVWPIVPTLLIANYSCKIETREVYLSKM